MEELLRTANCAPFQLRGSRPPQRDPVTGVTSEHYAMAHAAGYVSTKCRRVDPALGTPSAFADEKSPVQTLWTRLISQSGLSVPSQGWPDTFHDMDAVFCAFHHLEPDGLSRKPGVITDMTDLLCSRFPSMDAKVVRKYARLRTFIRLGSVNRRRQKINDSGEKRETWKRKQFAS